VATGLSRLTWFE